MASDASPLAGYTDKIVYLADHELAVLTADSLRVIHRDQGRIDHRVHVLDMEAGDVDLGGYRALHAQGDLRAARVDRQRHARPARPGRGDGEVRRPEPHARSSSAPSARFVMTACGTSWHAALVGEYLIEALARHARSKSSMPASSATAIRRWTTTRCCSPSRRAARRPTRWPPCGR